MFLFNKFLNYLDTFKFEKSSDLRAILAKLYIKGKGIEIGALSQPLVNPNNAKIFYVDNKNYEELCAIYPEVDSNLIVRPDIVCSGDKLEKIEANTYDFVIGNHVIEHISNPIMAIENWIRVLKKNGILYMSIPNYDNFLDSGRGITTLEHLIMDYEDNSDLRDLVHFYECAYYWGKCKSYQDIQNYIQKYFFELRYPIHYHVFNKQVILDLLNYISRKNKGIKIVRVEENVINGTKEFITILQKT